MFQLPLPLPLPLTLTLLISDSNFACSPVPVTMIHVSRQQIRNAQPNALLVDLAAKFACRTNERGSLGNLLLPCSLTETSDTGLSGIN